MNVEARAALLQHAGLLRFEQKTQILLAQLRASQPRTPFSAYDVCLIPALVEAMGYGRDRAFFRAIGQRLVGLSNNLPEPSGRAAEPSPLDTIRLQASGRLTAQWQTTGAWETIWKAITGSVDGEQWSNDDPSVGVRGRPRTPTDGLTDKQVANTISDLRAIFLDLSPARADIIICNVVLPFVAAVARIEQDQPLLEYAQELYVTYPGLTSNQVTRSMYRQLGLEREPKTACQQQGLHHIYTQTCREKHCATCIVVGRKA